MPQFKLIYFGKGSPTDPYENHLVNGHTQMILNVGQILQREAYFYTVWIYCGYILKNTPSYQ